MKTATEVMDETQLICQSRLVGWMCGSQAAGVQHAGGSGAPRASVAAPARPVAGRQPLLQERARRVAALHHPDHVLQAAAQPGRVHPSQVRAGERQRESWKVLVWVGLWLCV